MQIQPATSSRFGQWLAWAMALFMPITPAIGAEVSAAAADLQGYAMCESPDELKQPPKDYLACKIADVIEFEYQVYKRCSARPRKFGVTEGVLRPIVGRVGVDLEITSTDIDSDALISRIVSRLATTRFTLMPDAKAAPFAMRVDLAPAWGQSRYTVSSTMCVGTGY